MKLQTSQMQVTPLALRFLFSFFKVFPKFLLKKVLYCFFCFLFLFRKKYQHICERNLELAFPHLTLKEHRSITDKMKRSLARSLADMLRGDCISAEWLRKHVDLSDFNRFVKNLEYSPMGRIIISCHYHNFEATAQSMALAGYPMSMIARPMKVAWLERLVKFCREFHGNKTLPRKGAYKAALRELEKGRDVGIVFDQNVTRKNSIFVNLFGHPASTTKLPALLAYKTQANIVFLNIRPVDDDSHVILWKNVSKEIDQSDYSLGRTEFVEKVMTALNTELECMLREDPSGWFWMHRRWKTQSTDELETFYD